MNEDKCKGRGDMRHSTTCECGSFECGDGWLEAREIARSLSVHQSAELRFLCKEPATVDSPHKVDKRIANALQRLGCMEYTEEGWGFPTTLGLAVGRALRGMNGQ